MRGVASSWLARPGEKLKPTGWDRARLGVVVPLCVVVTIAIVCIIVAALTSAQRADDVAIEQEKLLFTKALANRGGWSQRRLAAIAGPGSTATDTETLIRQATPRIKPWLDAMHDQQFVVIFDSADKAVYSMVGGQADDPQWMTNALPKLAPLIGYLRGRSTELPDGVARLAAPDEKLFLQSVLGRPSIVSAAALGSAQTSGERTALMLAVLQIGDAELSGISDRARLANLRHVGDEHVPSTDYRFDVVDQRANTIASFAWTPHRPGAAILQSVVPFIGIALAGFAVLAGLVLRFMRHTAATIAAGENRLRYLAMHDPMCGLPNRIFFGERLESLLTEVRSAGLPAALLYIDLDHFKDVNDTLGHPVGDELIRSVTLRLSRTVRGEDLVARLGGDEFAVLTSETADHVALQLIAERIISALCAPYLVSGHTIVIGASIGIAVIDQRTVDAADVMRYADMALYRAKNEGRNRACLYDAAMDADLSNRKLVEQELRETIEHGRLQVLYQPIVNASGETVVGVEALARWPHPTRGLISPTEFIPIAEHSGLIIELGSWVLRRACTEGNAWPGLTVAVNVSPLQFRQVDFVNVVERILAETNFDPTRLELELTETTLIGNLDNAELAMRRLKALGVRLALDDFGTGYSSLHYLRRFPFDKLKIDRSFVLSIEKTADAAAIVHAVVSLGRGLGMKVTAEGVETADQHLFLRAAGVHSMQGFRFGRPASAADIAVRLSTPGVYRSIEGDAAALAS